MVFVNQDFTVRRRMDLESQDTEAIRLEIFRLNQNDRLSWVVFTAHPLRTKSTI